MPPTKKSFTGQNAELRMALAGALTWALPGAGHLFVGERVRGLILIVTMTLTFWTGVAIGGVSNTVNPQERTLWFVGQICAGGHALAAWGLGTWVDPGEKKNPEYVSFGRTEEIAVVYTAICGMLNVLLILDVLVRAERMPAPRALRGPPARQGSAV